MYFTETASLHEIEKLMKMIPNFSPRGHGMICGEERETETISLFKALAGIRYPPFQRRLRQYSKESEMNPMDYRNEKHQVVFENTIRKKNRKDYALMSAFYLLTADYMLWQSVRQCVVDNIIRFEEIRLQGLNENSYTLFCAAKDLYLGTDCLTISDLADTTLIPPKIFGLICNGMAVRRFGLSAIHLTGGSK
ncbi:hypothetical protein [Hydrogeniiclostridium mannosilyticum]|uniref:hypothetical protein n=1 Tax=Hydrogeniiclostridium mannosilyticum TaxID=2764322 RepID=UPI0018AA9ED2|nr:hypothetical protein [Hydrogeniiclostridium mannosilyticum]